MDNITEKCAVELRWSEVASIVSEEIGEVLGIHTQCKVIISEDTYWDVAFIGYRLPLLELFQLAQALQASQEDLEDTLPVEVETDISGIGMALAEKLVARYLKLTWEHHLITEKSLWLVGVTKDAIQ